MKFVVSTLAAGFALLAAQNLGERVAGPPQSPEQRGFLLPTGALLRPAGRQVALETFPMRTAVTPDARFLLVLNAGSRPPSITVLETKTQTKISSTAVPDGWLGLTLAANGRTVYVSGGSKASVYEFSLSEEGVISPARTFEVVREPDRKPEDFIGDVALSPDGRMLYAALIHRNLIAVINPLTGIVIERIPTGRRPYRILFHPNGQSFYVSSWADSSVFRHRAETGERLNVFRVGPHPTDMVWSDRQPKLEEESGQERTGDLPKARLFIASANTNNVYVFAMQDDGSGRMIETIDTSVVRMQPAGMTPSALALSADQTQLYIACSDANAVAVANVNGPRSRIIGFLPTGWYPTDIAVLPDGQIFVTNGKGGGSSPSGGSPDPGTRTAQGANQRSGTASIINPTELLTDVVKENLPFSHVEYGVTQKPPIEHVVLIVKEGRTFDQIFGDASEKGRRELAFFDQDSTPNHRKLARTFTLLNNFYSLGSSSAEGEHWVSAAIAPDYVVKLAPAAGAGRLSNPKNFEGDPAAFPPAGYLWTAALSRGLSVRNYGWWVENKPKTPTGSIQVERVRDPSLQPVTNMQYRGIDLDYPDVDRARIFAEDIAQFDRAEKMPSLLMVRLANDRTSGSTSGRPTPRAAMADNDLALGIMIEAISRSKFWRSTAVFVIEGSTNGPDHIDSHRAPALVISPFSHGGEISKFYNTASVLRTIEGILGLNPMTQFDGGAPSMMGLLSRNPPDTSAYSPLVPKQSPEERNPPSPPARSIGD